ncbi:lytic murein transglycosylase [Roseiterribacter gracilis]|uniref:lytic murein transglycosylase n=1 Tax=Roseiterribacter gracilis TaxID=2812848 RepID=UPI003B435727
MLRLGARRYTRLVRRIFLALLLAASLASPNTATAQEDFSAWLEALRVEANQKGIPPYVTDVALDGVKPIPRVVELDRKQPESTITMAQYLANTVSDARVTRGRELLVQHKALLQRISAEYGIAPRTIIALWAMESNYGDVQGNFKVIDALATLAFEGRRAAFFRTELLEALRILAEGHIRPDAMKGSWAGAMGQAQFMPSTFRKWAADGDGDGKRDIWRSTADVFASTANFMRGLGWKGGESWGCEVKLPPNFDRLAIGPDVRKTVDIWRSRGVKKLGGAALPEIAGETSIVQPDGPGGRAFLVGDNFRAVMKWNRSTYFAAAVGLLSDRIGGAP